MSDVNCSFVNCSLAPSEGVVNLNAVAITSTAITVSWVPPTRANWNGLITSYLITYSTVDEFIRPSITNTSFLLPNNFTNSNDPRTANSTFSDSWKLILSPSPSSSLFPSPSLSSVSLSIGPLTTESITINNLHEFVTYTFTVVMTTEAGPSNSQIVEVTTLQDGIHT